MTIKIIEHGISNSYNKGCRCKSCKKAKSDYRKELPINNHGTKWYYDKGCRCKLCKEAKSMYWKKFHPDSKHPKTTNVKEYTRKCHSCGKIKSLDEFGAHSGRLLDKMYECKNCHNDRGRKNKNKPSQRFSTYRSGAKVRGISFDLSYKQFMQYWCKPCYYCDSEIDGIGLDRKDSTKGYNIENIVPCCIQCNKSKLKKTKEQFISMCIKVAKKFGNHVVDLS